MVSVEMEPDTGSSRIQRTSRKKKRRRRWVARTLLRLVVWALVLAAVFVFGVGFGRNATTGPAPSGDSVTIEEGRGTVTATLPVTTVIKTKTVVKVKTVKRGSGRKR